MKNDGKLRGGGYDVYFVPARSPATYWFDRTNTQILRQVLRYRNLEVWRQRLKSLNSTLGSLIGSSTTSAILVILVVVTLDRPDQKVSQFLLGTALCALGVLGYLFIPPWVIKWLNKQQSEVYTNLLSQQESGLLFYLQSPQHESLLRALVRAGVKSTRLYLLSPIVNPLIVAYAKATWGKASTRLADGAAQQIAAALAAHENR